MQSYRTGALKGGGMGPETSHVHKISYGHLIDTALYVMCLMGENPLLGPLEGLGHINQRSINSYYLLSIFIGL